MSCSSGRARKERETTTTAANNGGQPSLALFLFTADIGAAPFGGLRLVPPFIPPATSPALPSPMPLLSGLFSRKHKSSPHSKRDDPSDSLHSTPSELDSAHSSPTTSSYVTPPHPNASRSFLHPHAARETSPANANVYAPAMSTTPSPSSGGKLRLFGRKKSSVPTSDVSNDASPEIGSKAFNTSPRPPQPSRNSTDTESIEIRRLRPPPSRSAIFAAYADPSSALSTRSLPNDPSSLSTAAADLSPSPSHQQSQKRPSLFPWTKPSSPTSSRLNESTSSSNLAQDSTSSPDASHSFNLKSFRHVRAPSPTRSNASNVSLTPPVVPRPRGASINSESSQRISVAAFREAQARRSLAGSPSPSLRSPSPAPALPREGEAGPRPARSVPSMAHSNKQQRRRSSMLAYTSDSEASQSESEDSEDETVQPARPSAFSRPGRTDKARAKSELGHGDDLTRPSRATKSHVGHSFSPSPSSRNTRPPPPDEPKKVPEMPPRSQSSLSQYTIGTRQRASASTSAITPSAAAKRASILANSNSNLTDYPKSEDEDKKSFRGQSRRPSETLPSAVRPFAKDSASVQTSRRKTQNSTESDSDDNAPLASLVAPKRPGSAMSSYSNANARSTGNVTTRSNTQPPKPLIDINELTGTKRTSTSPLHEKSMAGFTDGPTLLSQGKPLVESPVSQTAPAWPSPADDSMPITRTDPPHKFITPSGTPAKELEQYFDNNKDTSSSEKQPSLNAAPSPPPSSEPRRDTLSDRLTRVVQKNLTQGSIPAPQGSVPLKTTFSRPTSPTSDSMSDSSRKRPQAPPLSVVTKSSNGSQSAPVEKPSSGNHSPPDEELAQLLGTAVKFISRTGESSESSSESESETDDDDDGKEKKEPSKERIAPIPIKTRAPPPAFSVTSRPPLHKHDEAESSTKPLSTKEKSSTPEFTRPRSTTLTNATTPSNATSSTAFPPRKPSAGNPVSPPTFSSATSSSGSSNATSSNQGRQAKPEVPPTNPRQRSTTMLTGVPLSAQMPKSSYPTSKPFAVRRDSPASSTGDSSSGRAPLTPKDGSDFGPPDAKRKGHVKRRSVSFEDDMEDLKPPTRKYLKEATRSGSEAGDTSNEEDREQRRRERRRGEAKAAIELGKVINGPGPIVEDDDDLPINQTMNMNPRMSTLSLNPMMAMGSPMGMPMGFGGSPSPAGWGGNMPTMLSPAQFMIPPPADPNLLAAHQQAMMIAKQAYQMAVAQQAMAAAGDEWERGSAMGGFGGSVYGGSSPGPSMMTPPFGMLGMMQGNSWPSSASVYGGPARSMYGATLSPQDGMISSSRSEYGGPGGRGGANWSSSRSTYGESFGPSLDPYSRKGMKRPGMSARESGYFPPVPPLPAAQQANGRSSPDLRANPRLRTTSQPASPARGVRKAPPPSSWKAGV
ncbi:hypothetical protein CVT26_009813 [Gymnopilus dilepis]|uniref:Uncharacterized protein n=1 Tax=Gymnopilus dilepis TaxID=231916 RepID=A0A409YI99_9AGAR|nr:hypothetical protein CVT26_009813 [Gymnopilus dilepis]